MASDAPSSATIEPDAATLAVELNRAAERLAAGRLVAFPTETVYGLGADAADDAAVRRIFAAKGRPSDHPLIVHLPVGGDPAAWARDVPDDAQRLIDRFWPGPLTLILPRRVALGDAVGHAAAGGQDSIGLRCPAHPVAQALLGAYAALRGTAPVGVAAPSANRFGRVSPTTAAHVRAEFDGRGVDLFVIDGGPCDVGIESTIVDCTRLATVGPVLLRPGAITAGMIAEVIGRTPSAPDADAPRASGTLASHYAPATPVVLVDAEALDTAADDVLVWTWSAKHLRPRWHRAPRDATVYAHALYATLRSFDDEGAAAIWIERPPATAAWTGVNDRLQRAAAAGA